MKISKNSWHYRLINLFDIDHSYDLCSYFWQVIGSIFLLAILVLISASVVFCSFSIIGHFFIDGLMDYAVAGGILWICSLTIILIGEMQERKAKEEISNFKPENPSILVKWLKAKKEKICPILKFE